ncbi:MAG: hypothetical protein V7784_17865 [Oceanospirillaceae bacterium]
MTVLSSMFVVLLLEWKIAASGVDRIYTDRVVPLEGLKYSLMIM